jgi:hypothetical protein
VRSLIVACADIDDARALVAVSRPLPSRIGYSVLSASVVGNIAQIPKHVTKPGAYLKLDGDGAWWCNPDRLETLRYALGSRRLVAWSRSLSETEARFPER